MHYPLCYGEAVMRAVLCLKQPGDRSHSNRPMSEAMALVFDGERGGRWAVDRSATDHWRVGGQTRAAISARNRVNKG